MLYGIGECARAREAVACLRTGDMNAFGALMNHSHQGERRFLVADDLSAEPYPGRRLRRLPARSDRRSGEW